MVRLIDIANMPPGKERDFLEKLAREDLDKRVLAGATPLRIAQVMLAEANGATVENCGWNFNSEKGK